MNDLKMFVSRVLMPERGVFLVRVDDELVLSGKIAEGTRGRFIVALDYGEDVGMVTATEEYSHEIHGERIPGFRLLRPFEAKDERTFSENATLASAMCNSFLATAREAAPDIRIVRSRLSFGRQKLFIGYATETSKPNLSAATSLLKTQFGVDTNLWLMGPRDEVAELGGLGPCGRICCCCCWQRRFPSHIAPDRRSPMPALMNGTCGRFKCCLAF